MSAHPIRRRWTALGVLLTLVTSGCTGLITAIILHEDSDVGSVFGTDQFSFPGGRTATLHAPAHVGFQDAGQATLTISKTQLK